MAHAAFRKPPKHNQIQRKTGKINYSRLGFVHLFRMCCERGLRTDFERTNKQPVEKCLQRVILAGRRWQIGGGRPATAVYNHYRRRRYVARRPGRDAEGDDGKAWIPGWLRGTLN